MKKFIYLLTLLIFFLSLSVAQSQDIQAPVPRCIGEAVVNTTDSNITIQAISFDDNSFDETTKRDALRFTFSSINPDEDPDFDQNINSSVKSIDTDSGQIILDVYVWDESGNSDFCTILLSFTDDNGAEGMIQGSVMYHTFPESFDLPYSLELENLFNPDMNTMLDFDQSSFNISGLVPGSYQLKGYSNEDPSNGVSTLDLVLILKHMLYLDRFDDPYSVFAADVYQDNIINTLDILQLRQLILGMISDFDNNTIWRFGDSEQEFPEINELLQNGLHEKISFSITDNSLNMGFKAIKTGDVNHSILRNLNDTEILNEMLVNETNLRDYLNKKPGVKEGINRYRVNSDTAYISMEEVIAEPGDFICVPVLVENFIGVAGFQLPFKWDPSKLSFQTVENPFSTGFYYNEELIDQGELLMVWTDNNTTLIDLEDGTSLLELCFEVTSEESQVANIEFNTTLDFQPGVFNFNETLPFNLFGGQIGNGAGCVENLQVALGIDGATVFAENLYLDESPNDLVLVNGESSISFTCEDLGEQEVTMNITFEDGSGSSCISTINVVDLIPPVAIVEAELDLTLNNNLQLDLNPEMFLDGSYDNCSEIEAFIFPEVLDCSSPNPEIVIITVVDESGNQSQAYSQVNIHYPEHPSNALVCKEETDILIAPGEILELTADWLLEGPMSCNPYYDIEIFSDNAMTQPQPDLLLSSDDVGNTYIAEVTDSQTGNQCWTSIHILQGTGNAVVLSLPHETTPPNEDICLPLSVYNFTNIGGFQFPISWDNDIIQLNEVVIPDDNPIDLNLNSNFNIHDSEVWVAWFDPNVSGIDLEDGDILMELCFTAIGPYESVTPVGFFSESGFLQTEVISASGEALDLELVPGEVFIYGAGCVSSHHIDLDALGTAVLAADDLFYSEVPYDNVSFNNGPTMEFSCDDLGVQVVELIITYDNNNVETCEVEIFVEDITAPVAIANQNIEIELGANLEFILTPDLIDEGSYDMCGSVNFMLSPMILDCNSPNPSLVYLTVTDESGNQSQVFTEVEISNPPHSSNSISCNGDVSLTLTPNNEILLTADLFLAGEHTCAGYYNLFAYENNDTQQPLDDLIMDYTDGGNTYLVIVQDPQTGIQCSSNLHIVLEDCSEPFQPESINWPCNISVQSCELTVFDLSPNVLIEEYEIDHHCAEPQLDLQDCHIVGVTYEDIVFEGVDSSTVIRQWTIIDWLHFDPVTQVGIFQYEQQIIVYQSDPDALVVCDWQPWNTPVGDCQSGHSLDDMVEWPADIIVSSSQIHPLSLKNNPNVHPFDVEPRLFGVCVSYNVFFDDLIINNNNGQTLVERTWLIIDLANNQVFEYIQLITVEGIFDIPVYCSYSMNGTPIPGVKLYESFETGNSGCVTIPDIEEGTVISPIKQDNWQTGLDLMDLITLYKAVLGAVELNPYQLIAADINQSGAVTTLDAVLLEGIIDGSVHMNDLPWKFVDANYVFENAGLNSVPVNFPSYISYENGSMGASFIGIKMGDINDSYQTGSFTQNLEESIIKIKDEALFNGNNYEVPVIASESYVLEGLKLFFSVDETVLDITGISGGILGELTLGEEAFFENGKLRIDFSVSTLDLINETGIELSEGDILFTIECSSKDNGLLHSSLALQEDELQLVKKQSSVSPEVVQLNWVDIISGTADLINGDNIILFPHPASEKVNILSNTDLEGTMVKIYNSIGQLVHKTLLENNWMNVSHLEEGIYLVAFENGDISNNKLKLVISR